MNSRSTERLAATILEVLAVIGIVGLSFSILLPAIQYAREATRLTQCSNRVRQLVTGLHHHESRLGRFPSNGGDQDDSFIESSTGNQVPIRTHDLQIGRTFRWGIGAPGATPEKQPGSWGYAILPDIGKQRAYQIRMVEGSGSLFLCPSRSRESPAIPIDDAYGHYEAAGRIWGKTDFAGNSLAFGRRPKTLRHQDFSDGLGHTLSVGEKAFDPLVQLATSWYWDEPVFSGGSRGTVRSGIKILTDRPGIEFKNQWGSAHRSVGVFALFDGSTRKISRKLDWMIMRSLLTPSGQETSSL